MPLSSNAQEQKEIARFYVTSAKNNGIDITPWAKENGLYTIFYTIGNTLHMANYAEKANTQSWGPLWGMTEDSTPETQYEYAADSFCYNWDFQNSYDTKKGTCKVEFHKIYKPNGVESILRIITQSGDLIEYSGYMRGSLKNFKY